MRVLLVGEVAPAAADLRRELRAEDVVLEVAHSRAEGEQRVSGTPYDVILMGALGREGGLPLLRAWRRAGLTTHVLALTAPGDLSARVQALNAGADDCLSQPFAVPELLARLRALQRRGVPAGRGVLRSGDLELDPSQRTVKRAGQTIPLTPREYALLEFLAQHRGRVVSRSLIYERLYDDKAESASNVVDVYIRYLRKKIDRGFGRPLILTRWGEGYLLRDEEI